MFLQIQSFKTKSIGVGMKNITIGKFKFQKTWVFPSDVSKFLIQTIARFSKNYWDEIEKCWKNYPVAHVCCGKSIIGDITVDIDPENNPTLLADAWSLSKNPAFQKTKMIITDPPWQINWRQRQLFSYEMRDCLEIDGILIQNSPWSPWCVGMEILEIWKVSSHFNNYSDLRDWWILRKVSEGNKQDEI